MFKDSPYAHPVSSFNKPVPLVSVDPDDNPDITVCFRREWLPYIVGSLQQLLLQSTWKTSDPVALNTAQGQAQLLISMFVQGCDLPDEIVQAIGGLDEDIELSSLCEMLRYNNGKLQAYCCGAWVDISGQPAQGWGVGATGSGAAQPASGGGCVTYHAELPGNGLWLLPTVVSTGDTILISSAVGATYNPANGLWHCPDGSQFFAGGCVNVPFTAGGNPVPAAPSGSIVAKIGSTFYDVHSGTFTVPAGITAQPVTFQMNYASIATSSGTVQFDVLVCNNAAVTYTHTFNFLLSNGGFSVENLAAYTPQFAGAWASGSGWLASGAAGGGATLHGIQIQRVLSASHLVNSAELTYDLTKGVVNSGITTGMYLQLGATNVAAATTPSNTDPNGTGKKLTVASGSYSIDRIIVEIRDGFSTSPGTPGSSRAYQLVVTGPGADPW